MRCYLVLEDNMRFESGEIDITLQRDYYCFATLENGIWHNDSGTEVMVIYWSYSCPDGFGSITEEYITVEDICKLCKGLKELEFGVISEFSMEFFELEMKAPLINLDIKRVNNHYHFKLGIYDTVFSEYISVDNTYAEEEWQAYAKEFMEWGKKQHAQLGAKARTKINVDDDFFWLGREGTVVRIYPKEESTDSMKVDVSFTDYGWDRKPYQSVRLYDIDEVKILRPGEELNIDDLNRDLLSACISEKPDYTKIERILQQGARPLARIKRSENSPREDILYNRVIEHYLDDDTDDYDFAGITELFVQYGMHFNELGDDYQPSSLHPLWHFAFYTGEGFLRSLKLLLDRKEADKRGVEALLGHALLDWLTIDGSLEEEFDFDALRDIIRKIMLIASYPHILSKDEYLRDFIWLSENQYDLEVR